MDENAALRVDGPGNTGGHHHATAPNGSAHKTKIKANKRRLVSLIVGTVIVVAFLVCGWLLSQSSATVRIDGSKFQAVFLTNGQVYFGKLQKLNGGYFRLTEVFYLQAADDNSTSVQKAADSSGTNIQLIKLGSEVHGPDDEMVIDKGQILFFENLKKDGKVTQSIDKYLKK